MLMGETVKKGTRVTGIQRSKLAALLAKRYDSGESIRSLAASTGPLVRLRAPDPDRGRSYPAREGRKYTRRKQDTA